MWQAPSGRQWRDDVPTKRKTSYSRCLICSSMFQQQNVDDRLTASLSAIRCSGGAATAGGLVCLVRRSWRVLPVESWEADLSWRGDLLGFSEIRRLLNPLLVLRPPSPPFPPPSLDVWVCGAPGGASESGQRLCSAASKLWSEATEVRSCVRSSTVTHGFSGDGDRFILGLSRRRRATMPR